MKKTNRLLIASVLLMMLFLNGCLLRGEDEATAQPNELASLSAAADTAIACGLIANMDKNGFTLQFFDTVLGRETALSFASKQKVGIRDPCLVKFTNQADSNMAYPALECVKIKAHYSFITAVKIDSTGRLTVTTSNPLLDSLDLPPPAKDTVKRGMIVWFYRIPGEERPRIIRILDDYNKKRRPALD